MTRGPHVVAVLAVIAACNPPDRGPRWRPAGATTPVRGGTLRASLAASVRTLDPGIAFDEFSFYPVHAIFDTLLDYAPASTALVPRLAERWEVSADRRSYRFFLREARYSDGTQVLARDVETSLERALTSPESPFGPYLGDVVGASEVLAGTTRDCTGISAPSDRELVIELRVPNEALPYVLTMPFTTPQPASHLAAASDQLRRTPLGSGPYMLDTWSEGEELVLRRNPYHVDPSRGLLERIVLRENVPVDLAFLTFESGELDVAGPLSAADQVWIAGQEAWRPYVQQRAMMSAMGARMNVRVPPFTDRRVRQAFNYAVNKDHLVRLLHGAAVPSHGLLAPGVPGRDDTLVPYPHDPAKARALLAEAGFPDGLDVEYVTYADEETETVAASLQADLAEVGVRMRISVMSFATSAAAIGRADGPALSFDAWIGDYPDASAFFDPKFHSRAISAEGSSNSSFYANPELDALLDAARAEHDAPTRAGMYRRAERILYEDAPWIWGVHRETLQVTQPYVRDLAIHPVWGRDYTTAWLDLGSDGERVRR